MEISNNSSVVMTSSWHQAVQEAKRQYEAIDGALEVNFLNAFNNFQLTPDDFNFQTLHGIQNIVKDCPELAKMQRELEETNFNTINILPLTSAILTNGNMMSADLNANETINSDNGNAQICRIDSAA